VNDGAFEDCRVRFFDRISAAGCCRISFPIEFRSNRSRLGQYLLVNSDGEAWLPDEAGRTLHLGSIFGRESEVLEEWGQAVAALFSRSSSVPLHAL
jgi:hypothetical protein